MSSVDTNPLFFRFTPEQVRVQDRAVRRLIRDKATLLHEMERQMAEYLYRRPVHLLGNWYIRPFWRDIKPTPPLPVFDRENRIVSRRRAPSALVLLGDPDRVCG